MLEWIYDYELEKHGKPMNLNYGTRTNDSPLLNAANNGELETVKWLFEVIFDLDDQRRTYYSRKVLISITLARATALRFIEQPEAVISRP